MARKKTTIKMSSDTIDLLSKKLGKKDLDKKVEELVLKSINLTPEIYEIDRLSNTLHSLCDSLKSISDRKEEVITDDNTSPSELIDENEIEPIPGEHRNFKILHDQTKKTIKDDTKDNFVRVGMDMQRKPGIKKQKKSDNPVIKQDVKNELLNNDESSINSEAKKLLEEIRNKRTNGNQTLSHPSGVIGPDMGKEVTIDPNTGSSNI